MWHFCDITQAWVSKTVIHAFYRLFPLLRLKCMVIDMLNMKLSGLVAVLYIAVVTVSIIVLTMFIHVLEITDKKWDIAGLAINSENIEINADGDTTGDKWPEKTCQIPIPDIRHPFCEDKVKFLLEAPESPCFAQVHKGGDIDTCSILIFLSEIEQNCPRLPWREASPKTTSEHILERTMIRDNFDNLLGNLLLSSSYKWMRNRIESMKKDWKKALLSLSKKRNLSVRSKKKVLIFLGAFATSPFILETVYSGGPLGELVQWSDVITSIYLLGHEMTIVSNKHELLRFLPKLDDEGCISRDIEQPAEFDLIFTDITGMSYIWNNVGPYSQQLRCKMRILDSFGTQAEFNYPEFDSIGSDKFRSDWGGFRLNLRQFMTMYPHSPDNSFMGFVSGAKDAVIQKNKKVYDKNKGLVYGKQDFFFAFGSKEYLDQIHKHVEIHGTYNESLEKRPEYIPDYVINHGIVTGTEIQNLLLESKVFIGMGFPFEGPAPLEAIANGVAFINRKFPVPLNRDNYAFFDGKPTRRLVTSQNPYVERFIGPPYVYTIDIKNVTEVEITMRKIMKTRLKPFIPYEYTHEGMLERISAQIENLDFCHDRTWPPLKNMVTVKGVQGQSCEDACWQKGLLCEPSYWEIVNHPLSFRKDKIICVNTAFVEMTVAPSYQQETKKCYLQRQSLLFSCVASDPSHIRICPCRDYIKGQVALCKECW